MAVCGAVDWWRWETWIARAGRLSAGLEEPEIRASLEIILLGLGGLLRSVVVVGASRCRVPVGDLKIEAGVGSLAKASFRDILLIETQSTVYGILLMDQNGVLLKDLEASSLYLAIHYCDVVQRATY